jgi:hypothetical protein
MVETTVLVVPGKKLSVPRILKRTLQIVFALSADLRPRQEGTMSIDRQQIEAREQRFRKLSEQAQRDTAGLTMKHWRRRLHELMVRIRASTDAASQDGQHRGLRDGAVADRQNPRRQGLENPFAARSDGLCDQRPCWE